MSRITQEEARLLQEKKITLLKTATQEDKQFNNTRIKLKYLLAVLILVRSGYLFSVGMIDKFETTGIATIPITIIFLMVISISLYSGVKEIAILGFASALLSFKNIQSIVLMLNSDYLLYKMNGLLASISIIYQLCFMVYILLSPDIKIYSRKMHEILALKVYKTNR